MRPGVVQSFNCTFLVYIGNYTHAIYTASDKYLAA